MQLIGIPLSERFLDDEVSEFISGQAIQRARVRIRFDVNNWDQMAWYVNFSKATIQNLSDGDLLNIQEEVTAICHAYENRTHLPLLTRTQLEAFQKEITEYLTGLVDVGAIEIGPITHKILISRPKYRVEEIWSPEERKNAHPDDGKIKLWVQPIVLEKGERGSPTSVLRLHFVDLCSLFANSLYRCPKCQEIFLQFRRHAKFCSRVCQSRAAMETFRGKEKTGKSKTKPSTKKHQRSASKRRK